MLFWGSNGVYATLWGFIFEKRDADRCRPLSYCCLWLRCFACLDVEAEVHDVAILYDVFFAFYAHFAGFFDC